LKRRRDKLQYGIEFMKREQGGKNEASVEEIRDFRQNHLALI